MTQVSESQIAADVAQALVQIGAVGVSPEKPITFKSGILSPVYVDNRCLPFYPAAWRVVIDGFSALIDSRQLRFDVIAGVAVGGVPHSSALAYSLGKPSVFIRKEAKEHGKQKRVEGGEVNRLRILMVEDLVTSGGSSLSAVEALRAEGGNIEDVLAIVSYGFSEATEAFAQAGVKLHSLTNFAAVLEAGMTLGKFTAGDKTIAEDWLSDPHGWGERQGH